LLALPALQGSPSVTIEKIPWMEVEDYSIHATKPETSWTTAPSFLVFDQLAWIMEVSVIMVIAKTR